MNVRHSPAAICLLAILLLAIPACPPARGDSIKDVKHVVILMQENHSFDQYFGTMRGVRGFSDPNILLLQNGSSVLFQPGSGNNFVLPIQITNTCLGDGAGNDEDGGLDSWNNGWWDQWFTTRGSSAMSYFNSTNLPFYHALADAYTICDNTFCSFTGPTFPNRIYLFTGMVDPNGTGGGPALDNNVPAGGYHWTTYPERLQSAGVSWRVYRSTEDWFGDALQFFAQYKQASPGNPLYDRGMATVNDVISAFAADVTNGTLPQVSWVNPPSLYWSEHAPYDINRGEYFVQHILAALAANPAVFKSTVFILNYDENGGYFDHIPAPVPPPGTTNEFVHGSPLGLGIRVPMFIISPWSRGGRVCSQVFDHTSVIRFLETWTGVQEPNISAWRRQTCGDLTSALDFAHPDTSSPNLPPPPPPNNAAPTASPVPAEQFLPVQDPGTRPACPLPYQPDASCTTDCNHNRVFITMTNAGTASVHFAVYPNSGRMDGPWQYDAPPGGSVNDSFTIASRAKGQYDFTCYGPNGFQRRFAGNINQDCNQIEITSQIDPVGGWINVGMSNATASRVNFTITDNLNGSAAWNYALASASSTNSSFPVIVSNSGWYDLTVTADADPSFMRHLAGHIENGSFSLTEAPCIVGNPLQITTNPPVSKVNSAPVTTTNTIIPTTPVTAPGPVISSINDMVNYLIAQNSLATVGTNSLTLTVGAYGSSCALIYPAWASNCVVESTATLKPVIWTQLNTSPTIVSNCTVVILPATNAFGFFRLRQ